MERVENGSGSWGDALKSIALCLSFSAIEVILAMNIRLGRIKDGNKYSIVKSMISPKTNYSKTLK